MMLFRVCSLLVSALLLSLAAPAADAQCTTPRVRRSWTSLSSADRTLYKDAVAASMDSGAYIKFVEIHTEMMSEMEAHGQCMFIYWHRLFLVAFENMLRGQGTKYQCVTIPYWDWMTDYNSFVSGKCNNILACSPALSYMGNTAPVSSGTKSVTINGSPTSGYCEADAPMNHFCQSSKVSGWRCAKCMPRSDWTKASFPGSASYASVRAQLFGSNTIGDMSKAIEEGAHNSIHGELGSTMGSYESPADPIFWSHHAMIDMLHAIFHKCKVGEQKLTMDQKIKSAGWTTCERRNGVAFNPRDYVTMRTGYMGQSPVNATKDVKVGKFFNGVPLQFAALMDTRDLGSSSYSYELQGLAGTMYTQCGSSPTARLLTEEGNPNVQQGQAQGPVGTPATPTSAPPSMGALINTTISEASDKVKTWLNTTDKIVKKRGGNAIYEAEKMTCLFQDECLGGVTTYTEEFKAKFHLTKEPRCKQIVDKINRRADSVKVTEWKAQMIMTFGCPNPKTQTTNPVKQGKV